MASTPPPPSPSDLRIPRAPRHGAKHDEYEPYPTRYSARLAGQRASRAVQTTPPPSHPSATAKPGTSKRTLSPSSPGTAKASPKKAARYHRTAASRISPFDSELSLPRTSAQHTSRSSAEQALPTPAKTPSKKKVISSSSSTSRSLFPSISTPKRRKMDNPNHSVADPPAIFADEPLMGYTIQATGQELGISIHEDSRDRIPVVGPLSTDSFTPKPARAVGRPATRSTTSLRDGAYFVHRGKKVFKRFDDMEEEGEDEDDLGLFASRPDLLADNPDVLRDVKPLRRGEIKPRVLFPTAVEPTHGEEEDVTDVEDHEDHEPMSPTPAYADLSYSAPPMLPDTATSFESEVPPISRSAPVGRTGLCFPRTTASYVPPIQSTSSSEDLAFNTSTDETLRPRCLSISSSSSSLLKYWPPVSRKTREPDTRSDRVKRLREARGSPGPRTRQALRAEASAEASTTEPSTSDS
ncbi:uncharacterized protein N7479_009146 [Penicillium vulpinum]|uniref:Uncharacterized protein n=1 Tax=Penicillium vulpinum TaxID=29845 RepID=A0A1V6RWG1_9EURO|nr:uncharacterized protein N7479_009146 [Penicillium vulpinum]KAJ5950733.1 hypothetical protein N7479_009146 [Penicillium vulpinum]OQE05834.1 hypothetical protein PENVUL_c021G06180 [Penicillium vulpinum]